MPFDDKGSFDRIKSKLRGFFSDIKSDMDFIGGIIATEIIRTTLAGIGKGDQPFAPYSKYYSDVLEALGGKPRQNVDLRGIISPPRRIDGKDKKRRRKGIERDRGQGRKAIITGWAGTFELETRPQRGLKDPLSELSLELIRVESDHAGRCKIIYEPRSSPHMITHQHGAQGNPAPPWWHKQTIDLPARPWFTVDKAAVKAAAIEATRQALSARVQWFNDHGGGMSPPRIALTVTE